MRQFPADGQGILIVVVFPQKFIGPFEDLLRQTRQTRNMDAVTAVRAAPHDAAQENDVVAPFLDGDGIIPDAFQDRTSTRSRSTDRCAPSTTTSAMRSIVR